MDDTLKQEFTRRISQCNKGELVVIKFEIAFAYIQDAKAAKEADDYEAFKQALHNGQDVLNSMIKALDFAYDISKQLHPLYVYCRNLMAKAISRYKVDEINEAEKILRRLHASFKEAAKSDTSGPLMQNVQKVYAGITYGKMDLNESYMNYDTHRGFLA